MKDVIVAIFLATVAIIDVLDKPESDKWSWLIIGVLILIWLDIIEIN